MTYPPEKITFTIHRGGRDIPVEISRELVEDAIGPERLTLETMAEWIQINMRDLVDVADRKLADAGPAGEHITIGSDDLRL